MRPPDNEPVQAQIEMVVTDEERQALEDPDVPEEVKAEIVERLERFRQADLAQARAEDAGNEP